MSDQLFSSVVTITGGIIMLAMVATLVSKNAQTSNIIGTAGNAFSGALQVAESPVTGSSGLNVAGTYSSAGFMQ
jgi:PRD1 phage membrane DNA delivery